MRIFQIEDDWSIDNLRLTERPDPEPGPGEVLIRLAAASLNYRDLVVLQAGYGRRTGGLPLIPLSDGAGEVVALGAGVRRVALGDRVCPLFTTTWQGGEPSAERFAGTLGGPVDGTMADLMAISEHSVAKVPAHLSDEEGATPAD